jgi:hypothetical protein
VDEPSKPIPIAELDLPENNTGWVPVMQLTHVDFMQRQMQVHYAIQMAHQIIQLLTYYQHSFSRPIPTETVELWQASLVANDPFIAQVRYMPADFLSIEWRSQAPVVPALQGLALTYQYQDMAWAPLWSLNELLGVGANAPADEGVDLPLAEPDTETGIASIEMLPAGTAMLEVFHSMGVITSYCDNPQGYVYPLAGMVSDAQWCPAWHSVVMPSRR